MSWKAESIVHLVPLGTAAGGSGDGATAEAGTERIHAYPVGARWRSPKMICTTCARRERDCWPPDIGSRTLLAPARGSRRSSADKPTVASFSVLKQLEAGS
jgi:hypothetical protein